MIQASSSPEIGDRELIEFRVNHVNRYILTCYTRSGKVDTELNGAGPDKGSVVQFGEYSDRKTAQMIGRKLGLAARHERIDSLRCVIVDGEELLNEKFDAPKKERANHSGILPSRFQIGDQVQLRLAAPGIKPATVVGVEFQAGKVHYLVDTVDLPDYVRVDSCDIEPAGDAEIEYVITRTKTYELNNFVYFAATFADARQRKEEAEREHGSIGEWEIFSRPKR